MSVGRPTIAAAKTLLFEAPSAMSIQDDASAEESPRLSGRAGFGDGTSNSPRAGRRGAGGTGAKALGPGPGCGLAVPMRAMGRRGGIGLTSSGPEAGAGGVTVGGGGVGPGSGRAGDRLECGERGGEDRAPKRSTSAPPPLLSEFMPPTKAKAWRMTEAADIGEGTEGADAAEGTLSGFASGTCSTWRSRRRMSARSSLVASIMRSLSSVACCKRASSICRCRFQASISLARASSCSSSRSRAGGRHRRPEDSSFWELAVR